MTINLFFYKNSHNMNKLILFVFSLCFSSLLMAQQKAEVGLLLGGANYQGDVASSKVFSFKQTQAAGGVYARYNVGRHFSLRGSFFYTKLKGDDLNFVDEATWRADRGFSFSNPVYELSFTPEWHIFGNTIKRKMFRPYLFAGIGAAFTNPTNNLVEKDIYAVENEAGYYPSNHFSFPIGGGINFDLGEKLTLGVEASSHFPLTDYLDGISEAGNPDQKDWFVFGGVTLGYKFGKTTPKFVDTDGDGVSDDKDLCPLLAGKLQGCPDTDGDGIADRKDKCPDLAGSKHLKGCPDTDGDGIADTEDKCPNTKGVAGLNGCPDADADGIADADDKCPELAGSIAANGCPDDADGDGIADASDDCPHLKGSINGCPDMDKDGIADKYDNCPEVAGLNSMNGCPDTDGDGIADRYDNCPEVAGVAFNKGCPDALVSKGTDEYIPASSTYTYLVEDVYFRNTRAKISDSEIQKLNEVARVMQENPNYNLKIKGHTDDTGDTALNDHLSMRRARRCYKYLAAQGIALSRMSFEGYGATEPKYDNTTEEGKKKNRRVEFAFLK
ncbi:MAG TPA: OmpA family protein [Phaeodactylibacter sp.]|nr:OmpA family protein [Phaeodactylibacter sp.]